MRTNRTTTDEPHETTVILKGLSLENAMILVSKYYPGARYCDMECAIPEVGPILGDHLGILTSRGEHIGEFCPDRDDRDGSRLTFRIHYGHISDVAVKRRGPGHLIYRNERFGLFINPENHDMFIERYPEYVRYRPSFEEAESIIREHRNELRPTDQELVAWALLDN